MISVILPTYNEKKNIAIISKKLLRIKLINEIIFVDDRSIDGTFSEIKKLKFRKIKGFVRKAKSRDLSKSVMYGVKKAKNDYVLVMDCDLQHNTKYIEKLWRKIYFSRCDIVVANRFTGKKYSENLGMIRSLLSKFAIGTINLFFGKKTSDPLSGFFICKKAIFLRYDKKFYLKGYKILFDLIYNGKKGIKVKEQDIVFNKRFYEKSKFNLYVIWLFLLQMLYTKFVVKK